jgi:CheY-like chemotaxis protein
VGGTVDVNIIPGGGVWKIKADPTQLETAILNLSINARDAMKPKGGSLVVETQNTRLDSVYCAENEDVVPGDYVQISVSDTGCGIAPENIEKVFQPFFTTKGPEAGSGLGLSMIYGFVKQSGGHVKIYSEVGHGTSVKLFLPRDRAGVQAVSTPMDIPVMQAAPVPAPLQAQSAAEAVPVPELAPAPPVEKPLVLVVEDNESVREVAAAMIEEMGFDVLQASNGADGLQSIEDRADIALVLSDVIMAGGMNGPEMVSLALKLRPDLKVLFMSGYAPGSVRQMNDLPDSIELVAKPFTRADLTDKVRRAVAA